MIPHAPSAGSIVKVRFIGMPGGEFEAGIPVKLGSDMARVIVLHVDKPAAVLRFRYVGRGKGRQHTYQWIEPEQETHEPANSEPDSGGGATVGGGRGGSGPDRGTDNGPAGNRD